MHKILGIVMFVTILVAVIVLHGYEWSVLSSASTTARSLAVAFTVGSVSIVDHNGITSVKINFFAKKYPITFYLLSSEGEKLSQASVSTSDNASSLERVVYLSLAGWHVNIVGKRVYQVKAYYYDDELWSTTIIVNGVKPEVESLGVVVNDWGVSLKNMTIRNMGDVPLYISSFPENVVIYIDGTEIYHTNIDSVVMPNEEKTIPVNVSLIGSVNTSHIIQVKIAGVTFNYTFRNTP